jgi:tRNA(Arg) A34 adenosine deaminase TadA
LSRQAIAHGNFPFAALLVDERDAVVLEAENTVTTGRDCTGHAELNLMRAASSRFSPEYLRGCTLYASTEPCAMCAGAICWGGVGRVVFALGAGALHAVAGTPALATECRDVFAGSAYPVDVSGPHREAEARAVHEQFWARI